MTVYILLLVITWLLLRPAPVIVQSIAMRVYVPYVCLCVCLSVHLHVSKTIRPNFTKFSVYVLGPPLTTFQILVYFRFCG